LEGSLYIPESWGLHMVPEQISARMSLDMAQHMLFESQGAIKGNVRYRRSWPVVGVTVDKMRKLTQKGVVMTVQPQKILREAEAGMLDKGDVVIQLRPGPNGSGIKLDIESKVMSLFGDQIKSSVLEEIDHYQLTDMQVSVRDQGALDYAIRARVQTAIERAIREEK
jgi:citrate lyase subunit gamma (acyl carrier protein)